MPLVANVRRRLIGLVAVALLGLLAALWAVAARQVRRAPLLMCPGVWDVLSIGAPTLLSSNGRVLAVSGLATGSTPVEDRMATWFVDVDQGKVLARTTPGCFLVPVKAGPGESYVLLVMSPERQEGLYWVQSACAVPVRLDGRNRELPVEGATLGVVDGDGEWAVLSVPEPHPQPGAVWSGTKHAVHVPAGTPARVIGRGISMAQVVDLVERGTGEGRPLAMLAGVPRDSGAFVLSLVDIVSGDVVSAIDLGVPVGLIVGPVEYGPGTSLVAVVELYGTTGTHVVEVDLASERSRVLAVIPDSCAFATTVPAPGGVRAFVGSRSSVWELVSSPTGTVAREVVSVTAPSIPCGVRDAGRGPEVLLAMLRSRTIWRYVIDSGEMELVIGHPDGSNEAPEIVR